MTAQQELPLLLQFLEAERADLRQQIGELQERIEPLQQRIHALDRMEALLKAGSEALQTGHLPAQIPDPDPEPPFKPGDTVTWGSSPVRYTVTYSHWTSIWVHIVSPDGKRSLVAAHLLKRTEDQP